MNAFFVKRIMQGLRLVDTVADDGKAPDVIGFFHF